MIDPMMNVDPSTLKLSVTSLDGLTTIPSTDEGSSDGLLMIGVEYMDFLSKGIHEIRVSLVSQANPVPMNATLGQQIDISYPRTVNFHGTNKVEMDFLNPQLGFTFSLSVESPEKMVYEGCFQNSVYVTLAYYRWNSNVGTLSDILTKVTISDMKTDVFGNTVDVDSSTLALNVENLGTLMTTNSRNIGNNEVSSNLLLNNNEKLRIMAIDSTFTQQYINPNTRASGSMNQGRVVSYKIHIIPDSLGKTYLFITSKTNIFLQANYYDHDGTNMCSQIGEPFQNSVNISAGKDQLVGLVTSASNVQQVQVVNLFFTCISKEGCSFDFILSNAIPESSNKPLDETTIIIISVTSGIAFLAILAVLIIFLVYFVCSRKRKLNYVRINYSFLIENATKVY